MSSLHATNCKWLAFAGLSMSSFLGCIDFTIVNTALPAIQASLMTSVTQLQWVINSFILALSTFMVVMGRLADIYGRSRLLYIGMVIFGLASLGAGLAVHINALIGFRFLQGVTCAILYTGTGALIANTFPEQERGKAMGALFGINGVGLAIGPILGGWIISILSWHWIFLINIPVIAISLLICLATVREPRNNVSGTRIDWGGLALLLLGLPCLILGITQGADWGWSSPLTLILLVTAGLALISFYFFETKTSMPIIQFQLFLNRRFIASAVATAALAFFYCVAFFLMPLYLHNMRQESSGTIGLMLLPTTAVVALLSPLVGRLVDQIGAKALLVIGFICFVLSAALQTQFTADSTLAHILFSFVLLGIGWACVLGPSTVVALSALPADMNAVVLGASWTLHNIGGAIGLAVGTVIYHTYARQALLAGLKITSANVWVDKIVADPDNAQSLLQQYAQLGGHQASLVFQHFFLHGYQAAMWLLATVSLIAGLTVMLLSSRQTR